MCHTFNDILFLVQIHTYKTLPVMTCGCISTVYCFWIGPVVFVCVCVCVWWSLVVHMAGTWYNSLDNTLSLSFNSEDGGVYYSRLFTCFMKVHRKLNWTLFNKNICHWAPMLTIEDFKNGKLYFLIWILCLVQLEIYRVPVN